MEEEIFEALGRLIEGLLKEDIIDNTGYFNHHSMERKCGFSYDNFLYHRRPLTVTSPNALKELFNASEIWLYSPRNGTWDWFKRHEEGQEEPWYSDDSKKVTPEYVLESIRESAKRYKINLERDSDPEQNLAYDEMLDI